MTCVIDMVSGFYDIKDTLESKGVASLTSKIDSAMEFFYRIEGNKVSYYKINKIQSINGEYSSSGPAEYFFEYEYVTRSKFDSFLGAFLRLRRA